MLRSGACLALSVSVPIRWGEQMPSKPVNRSLETEFFRMLNRIVEPVIRAGVGSPRFVPSGFVVLETVGRKTGVRRRSPLAAT